MEPSGATGGNRPQIEQARNGSNKPIGNRWQPTQPFRSAWWRGYLEAGLTRMRKAGLLQADADPATFALSIFASLQGGLLLTQTTQSLKPLEAALNGAMTALRTTAAN